MRDFKNLRVWEKSHKLTLNIYKVTENFPKIEIYGLTSQIRRASVSIGANIAEGCGKQSEAEFARYLYIALGSASELEYHLILASDLQYITKESHIRLENNLIEIKKMLVSFIKKLKANS